MWFWYNLQYIYSYTIIISLKSQLEQPKVQFGGQFHEKTDLRVFEMNQLSLYSSDMFFKCFWSKKQCR